MRIHNPKRGAALWGAVLVGATTLYSQARVPPRSTAEQFEEAVTLVDSRGDCAAAVPSFERVASSADRTLAARALVYLGLCYERLGNEKARQAYRRVIDHYPDQRTAATQARARLAALDRSARPIVRRTLRPLWGEMKGLEIAGRPSADGRTMPFTDESGALVLADLHLGRPGAPILLGTATDGLPACTNAPDFVVLSPDGRQAAFNCEVSAGRSELRISGTDGKPPHQRRLLNSAVDVLDWRKADALLVQRQRRPQADPELAVVNVNTGALQQVTVLTAPVTGAFVSPDGEWVAFNAADAAVVGRHDVMIVSSNGGKPVAITAGPSDNQLPAWTPNGHGVLFVSDRTGSPGLWLQEILGGHATGTPQLLMQDLGRVSDVWAATPSGEFIYFRQTGLVKVGTAALKSDGSVAEPSITVTRQFGGTMMPGWSPDAARLAYQTVLTGTRAVVLGIKDLRTGEERMVTTPLQTLALPQFAPDGRSVAVKGRDQEGRFGLFLIDPNNGKASAVRVMRWEEEDRLRAYRWAADASLIVQIGNDLQRIDVRDGTSTTVGTQPNGVWRFAVHQQTGAIAYVRVNKNVQTLEVREPDGTARELLRAEPQEAFPDVDWTPDGGSVIFTRRSLDPKLVGAARWPALWRIDVKTLAARPTGLSLEGLRNVVVSPNGHDVAYTTGFPTREAWILEHYLPAAFMGAPRR